MLFLHFSPCLLIFFVNRGRKLKKNSKRKKEVCKVCDGDGLFDPSDIETLCPLCNGKGFYYVVQKIEFKELDNPSFSTNPKQVENYHKKAMKHSRAKWNLKTG